MRDYEFRWTEWNRAKCERHGVDPDDAEYVVRNAARPFPMKIQNEKIVVWGQEPAGRYLQVIYLVDPDNRLFVIHAMPLTESQRHQLRRRQP